MLYYSPQIWCSDNTDALTRMKIQYGTSLAYPTRCVGAHVSTVPNHITGSTTRLRTRAFVAMCGTFGFELDIGKASDKDLAAFKTQVELYKLINPVIRWGDMYRLWDPFKVSIAFACVADLLCYCSCLKYKLLLLSDVPCLMHVVLILTSAAESGCLAVRVSRQEPGRGVRVLTEQRPLEQPGAAPAAAGPAA
jgi:alpha-galactosidase